MHTKKIIAGVFFITFLIMLQLLLPSSSLNTPLRFIATKFTHSEQKAWNIAHRGNEAECLENSLPAFISADLVGADYVELDLVLTKDDIPIIYHNSTLNSHLECHELQKQKIANVTYEEIKQNCSYLISPDKDCDISAWSDQPAHHMLENLIQTNKHKILSFKDLLQILKHSEIGIFIELKDYMTHQFLDELSNLDPSGQCKDSNQNHPMTFNCYKKIKIISFSPNTLNDIKELLKTKYKNTALNNIEIFLLSGNVKGLIHEENLWGFDGVAFNYPSNSDNQEILPMMNELESRYPKKKKIIWTIQNTKELDQVENLPLDGIINGIPRAGALK